MPWFEEKNIFSRLFQNKSSIHSKEEVEVGDAFYQVNMGNSVWIVERICADTGSGIQHVVITRKGMLPGSKIISAPTLLNSELYRRDRRSEKEKSPKNKNRRKTDNLGFN